MIKRSLFFSNPVYLSLENNQLKITYTDKMVEKKSVPIEDIGIVLLEHQQITITNGLMNALIKNNCAIIFCDHSHMPSGLLYPLEGGNTQTERFRHQNEASLPLKKQLWQQTIQAKILNQAAHLDLYKCHTDNMYQWAKSVRSGDPDNFEARAAVYYWHNLFPIGYNFTRNRNGIFPNNMLNYGYAILRAIVARSLVSSGLHPTLGIFHRNKYNPYCLADDIMEPYRPYVDRLVIEIINEYPNQKELNTELKMRLMTIPQIDVRFDDITSPLLVGMHCTTASLTRCFDGSNRKITYPIL